MNWLNEKYCELYTARQSGNGLIGCVVVLFSLLIYFAIVGLIALWTDRSLDYVVSELKDKQTDVPYWLAFLVSLLAPAILLFNVVVEVIRL